MQENFGRKKMNGKRKIFTDSKVFSKGVDRNVVITVHTSGLIDLRLKGLRQTYQTTAGKLYWLAVQGKL